MKVVTLLTILLLSPTGFSEPKPTATRESLLAKRAELAKSRKTMMLKPVENEITIQSESERDVMESSSYLVGALGYTLIPNGSAPTVSKPYSLTTVRPEGLTNMKWSEFVRVHRNGLQVIPVTQKHLKPDADTQTIQERITALEKLGYTSITTYKQLPVRISQTPTPTLTKS